MQRFYSLRNKILYCKLQSVISMIEASCEISTAWKEDGKYYLKILENKSVELDHKTAGRGLSVPRLGSDSDESVWGSADGGN